MSRLKVYHNGDWEYADRTSGLPDVSATDNGKVLKVVNGEWDKGDSYDITVSGTSSSTDEPTSSDLSSATMTYNTTIAEMITKITGKGTVDINGQLHYDSGDGIVKYINVAAYKYPNEIVPYAAVAYYAEQLQKPAPKADQGGIGLTIHPTNHKANVSSYFKFYLYEDTTGTIQKIVM